MTDLLSKLWHTVFEEMPTLSQDRVVVLMQKMDSIIRESMTELMQVRMITDTLFDIMTEIAAGKTHGRIIFQRNMRNEQEGIKNKLKHKCEQVPCMEIDPKDFYYYNNRSDVETIAFLEKAHRFYAIHSSGKLTQDDIQELDLSRTTYEQIIWSFLERTEGYDALCTQWATTHDKMLYSTNSDASAHSVKLSDVEDQMAVIEEAVGCSREHLSRIRRDVMSNYKKTLRIRDQIFAPYMRIIYHEAKKCSTSDQQTLENIQNGAFGLMRAISNDNGSRGVFSSYARKWIRQAILLKLKDEANPIRMPISSWQTFNAITDVTQRLTALSGDGSVDISKIAEETGLDESKIRKTIDRFHSTRVASVENDSNFDDGQDDLHPDSLVEQQEERGPPVEVYLDLLSKEEAFVVILQYGLFEKLPGGLPTDSERIIKERLRQSQAHTEMATQDIPIRPNRKLNRH